MKARGMDEKRPNENQVHFIVPAIDILTFQPHFKIQLCPTYVATFRTDSFLAKL